MFAGEQHGAAGIARRAHKMVTLRSLDRNEVLLLFFPHFPHAVSSSDAICNTVHSRVTLQSDTILLERTNKKVVRLVRSTVRLSILHSHGSQDC